jgi:hypothetical protein
VVDTRLVRVGPTSVVPYPEHLPSLGDGQHGQR